MSIPGSDILEDGLLVIDSSALTYYRFLSRGSNDVGQDVAVYDNPTTLHGSFQPISQNEYQQLGLDFQKSYYNFYVSSDLIDIRRDVSGDQLEFNGIRYQCESLTKWFDIDGWVAMRCVAILDFN